MTPTVNADTSSSSAADHIFSAWLHKRVARLNAVYTWHVTRAGETVAVWTLDGKQGVVHRGRPATPPDVTITLDENDAIALVSGTLDAAKAFIGGQLKVSGNMAAAHKFQQFWSEEMAARTEERVPTDGLKADIVFHLLNGRMAAEPELVKAFPARIQFNVTRANKTVAVWTVDTKSGVGRVHRSAAQTKADAVVTVDDENLVRILFGELNPQRAFMTGKVKVSGNVLLLQKLDNFWNQLRAAEKRPELAIVKRAILDGPLVPGLESEVLVFELIERSALFPHPFDTSLALRLDITRDRQSASVWVIAYTAGQPFAEWRRQKKSGEQFSAELTVEDSDFVGLVRSGQRLQDAIDSGRVRLSGDRRVANELWKVLEQKVMSKL